MLRRAGVVLVAGIVLLLSGCGGSGGGDSTHSADDVQQAFLAEDLPLVRVAEADGGMRGSEGTSFRAKAPPAADPLQVSVSVFPSGDDAKAFEEIASDPDSQAFFSATGGGLEVLREANVVVVYDKTSAPDRLPQVRAALETLVE